MGITISDGEWEDVDAIVDLMEAARRQIADADWYVIDGKDYVERHVVAEGFLLKAEEDGKILAFFMVHIPKKGEENLGVYLKLNEKKMRKVAHMDSVAVVPFAQGKGLMGKLMKRAEEKLKMEGYEYLMGTVHPDNTFSHLNFLKQGYKDVAQVRLYGGLPRVVVCKKL